MDNQQAIEILKDFGSQVSAKADGAHQSTVGKMACDLAVAALEKQIQKKPILDTIYHQQYYCPNCEDFLTRKNEDKPHHCKCGQAIDWDN